MQKPGFFESGGFTSAPELSPRAAELHVSVDGGGAGANVGADVGVVMCAQTVCFCYCMRTLLANVFFAFAAKLHFVCILPMVLGPPCWLQGVLLSSDRGKMQILCLQFPYVAKTITNTNSISACFSKATYNHAKTVQLYKAYQKLLQQVYAQPY